MLITPTTKSITEYQLTLSEADAAEILADAYTFADKLAQQLRAAGATPAHNGNGNGHHKPGNDHPLGYKAQTRRASKRARKAGRPNGEKGGPSLEKVSCPDCGKEIASKFLALHRSKKHPEKASSETASVSAA